MADQNRQFELRKQEHIRLSLSSQSQASNRYAWDHYQLHHEAFPELNFDEINLNTNIFGKVTTMPLFISSMTAGHEGGVQINQRLAELSHNKQILMGVGSQRKELSDSSAQQEWKSVKKQYPKSRLMGNIGITQVITHSPEQILKLTESLQAEALIVHTNPLQEALQVEGTPQFRGGLAALEKLVKLSSVPIVVKEVGSGLGPQTLIRLQNIGVEIADISGKSGTHWGRIEGLRSNNEIYEKASGHFNEWGYFSLDVLEQVQVQSLKMKKWVSGGVRSGVDAAKALALGAEMVGTARPWLEAAILSSEALEKLYAQFELELKTSLFCTGAKTIQDLKGRISKATLS